MELTNRKIFELEKKLRKILLDKTLMVGADHTGWIVYVSTKTALKKAGKNLPKKFSGINITYKVAI